MQMGGGRRKRSTNEEEGYVSRRIHKCKGLWYNLESNVLIYLIIEILAITTKHIKKLFSAGMPSSILVLDRAVESTKQDERSPRDIFDNT